VKKYCTARVREKYEGKHFDWFTK